MRESPISRLQERATNRFRRLLVDRCARRTLDLQTDVPYISFTFDDFPRSALLEGGRVLTRHGAAGSYFVSLKLLGRQSPSGQIALREDLDDLLRAGHELGCHTYDHLDGRVTSVSEFERSIVENRRILGEIAPRARFSTFAYPLDGPGLRIKRAVGKHFACCRGGGQDFNAGSTDLNLLKSYFLDWRNQKDPEIVQKVIEKSNAARGWLVFSTHDVAAQPSRYGCTPEFFENVVQLAVRSGARVVPLRTVCQELAIPTP